MELLGTVRHVDYIGDQDGRRATKATILVRRHVNGVDPLATIQVALVDDEDALFVEGDRVRVTIEKEPPA